MTNKKPRCIILSVKKNQIQARFLLHMNINTMNNNTELKVLQDPNKRNPKKNNNWRGKKLASESLSASLKRIGSVRKALRVEGCGTLLEFKLLDDGSKKLHRANFCKVRLCPMCAWRRSLKVFGQVSRVMDELVKENNYSFLFLTLTTKNVKDNELNAEIDRLMKAFKLLKQRKTFTKSVKGFFRALEVTYNHKDGTFHPHFHCVLAVPNYYFKNSEYYINQSEWTELWQQALKVDYKPIVDVRKIKSNGNIKKAVAEVSKYTVKDSDYITGNDTLTDYLVDVFDTALAGRRLVAFGGIFKELHKRLNLDDAIDGDLVNTDAEQLREDVASVIVRYKWGIGATGIYDYYLVE